MCAIFLAKRHRFRVGENCISKRYKEAILVVYGDSQLLVKTAFLGKCTLSCYKLLAIFKYFHCSKLH